MPEIIVQFSHTFDFYPIDTGEVNKNRINFSCWQMSFSLTDLHIYHI